MAKQCRQAVGWHEILRNPDQSIEWTGPDVVLKHQPGGAQLAQVLNSHKRTDQQRPIHMAYQPELRQSSQLFVLHLYLLLVRAQVPERRVMLQEVWRVLVL